MVEGNLGVYFILLSSGISYQFSEQYFCLLEDLQYWLGRLHIFLLSPVEYWYFQGSLFPLD